MSIKKEQYELNKILNSAQDISDSIRKMIEENILGSVTIAITALERAEKAEEERCAAITRAVNAECREKALLDSASIQDIAMLIYRAESAEFELKKSEELILNLCKDIDMLGGIGFMSLSKALLAYEKDK